MHMFHMHPHTHSGHTEPCPVSTTLIVAPSNLIPQWRDEIKRHLAPGEHWLQAAWLLCCSGADGRQGRCGMGMGMGMAVSLALGVAVPFWHMESRRVGSRLQCLIASGVHCRLLNICQTTPGTTRAPRALRTHALCLICVWDCNLAAGALRWGIIQPSTPQDMERDQAYVRQGRLPVVMCTGEGGTQVALHRYGGFWGSTAYGAVLYC